MTFMIADGVRPSNKERGYVLRRIIRRAVRHAYLLGARDLVLPDDGRRRGRRDGQRRIPRSSRDHDDRREGRRARGAGVPRDAAARRRHARRASSTRGDVTGDDAFFLHDTLGFPIDLTREIAGERGRAVDLDGFEQRMARAARPGPGRGRRSGRGRRRQRACGASSSTSTARPSSPAARSTSRRPTSLALVVDGERVDEAAEGRDGRRRARPHAVLRGVGRPGRRHRHDHDARPARRARRARHAVRHRRARSSCTSAWSATGALAEGDEVEAAIDGVRRDRIRRNHTATHILHWALREVLGSHVQQAGSFVAPDRLRFDFSHHDPVTPEQLAQVERLANEQVISDAPVRHYETTKAEAERIGAIAFFGEKYGEIVRVLEAGPSTELCGGTHVHALGFIGPIKIVSEGSIGSNLRRIEAMTGDGALEYVEQEEAAAAPRRRRCSAPTPEGDPRQDRAALGAGARAAGRAAAAQGQGSAAAAAAISRRRRPTARSSSRRDGLGNDELRRLAQETVRALGIGRRRARRHRPRRRRPAIAVAVSKDLVERGVSADAIARPAAKALGGGVGQGRRRGGRRRPERRRASTTRSRLVPRAGGCSGRSVTADAPAGRVLGVDLGSRAHRARALRSRPARSRRRTRCCARSGDHAADHRAIVEIARASTRSTTIVVGLPLSLSGGTGPAARAARGRDRGAARASSAPASRSSRTTSGSRRSPPSAASTKRGMRRADRAAGRRQGRGRGDAPVVAGVARRDRPMITGDDIARDRAEQRGRAAPTRRRRGAGSPSVIVAVVLVPLLVLGSASAWFWWQLDPPGERRARRSQVQIAAGLGRARASATSSQHDHVIGSSLVFNVYARLNGDNSFQAGTYDLHKNMGVTRAVDGARRRARASTTSSSRSRPGCGCKQIAARVGKLPGPQRADRSSQAHAEQRGALGVRARGRRQPRGLVWPDTYKISNSQDEIAIL